MTSCGKLESPSCTSPSSPRSSSSLLEAKTWLAPSSVIDSSSDNFNEVIESDRGVLPGMMEFGVGNRELTSIVDGAGLFAI
jgi:hypothetical protein